MLLFAEQTSGGADWGWSSEARAPGLATSHSSELPRLDTGHIQASPRRNESQSPSPFPSCGGQQRRGGPLQQRRALQACLWRSPWGERRSGGQRRRGHGFGGHGRRISPQNGLPACCRVERAREHKVTLSHYQLIYTCLSTPPASPSPAIFHQCLAHLLLTPLTSSYMKNDVAILGATFTASHDSQHVSCSSKSAMPLT